MLDRHAQRAAAAVRIQSVWRGALLRASLLVAMAGCAVVNRAAVCLQRWCRWLSGCTVRLQLCNELYAYAALLQQQPTAPARTATTAAGTASSTAGFSHIDSSGSNSDSEGSDEECSNDNTAHECKLYIELEVYYAITMDIELTNATADTDSGSTRSPFRHLDNRAYNVPVWAHVLCTSSSGSSSNDTSVQNCKRLSNMTTADLLMRGVTRTGKLINTSSTVSHSGTATSTAAATQQQQQQQRFIVLHYATQAEACMRALHVYARTWTPSKRTLVTLNTQHMLQLATTARTANSTSAAVEMLTRSSSSGRQRKLVLPQCVLPSAWCAAVRCGMSAHDEVRINLLGQSLMLPAMALNTATAPAAAAVVVPQGKLQLCYDDGDADTTAAAVTSKGSTVQRSGRPQTTHYDSRRAQYKQLTEAVAAVYAGNSSLFIPRGATAAAVVTPTAAHSGKQQQQCSLTGGVDTAGSSLSVWQTSCAESDYAAVKALNCGWKDSSSYTCNGNHSNGYSADVVRLEVAVARRAREAQAEHELQQK
jgi:hypothetical protein